MGEEERWNQSNTLIYCPLQLENASGAQYKTTKNGFIVTWVYCREKFSHQKAKYQEGATGLSDHD